MLRLRPRFAQDQFHRDIAGLLIGEGMLEATGRNLGGDQRQRYRLITDHPQIGETRELTRREMPEPSSAGRRLRRNGARSISFRSSPQLCRCTSAKALTQLQVGKSLLERITPRQAGEDDRLR